jgi:class 3 adenylate cyclase/streptogramin lyase
MTRKVGPPVRLLATVLFTDIVGSTQLAAELGDRRWRQLLARHHAFVRRLLRQHGGREVDTAGDGFFATFDQPGRAIDFAVEIIRGLKRMSIDIRAGIHMGEVEVIGPKVGGIAVHIASRIMSMAGPGEVMVSSTVRDLMSGSDLPFSDQGFQELKGVPAQWRLYSVEVSAAGEASEAAEEAVALPGEGGPIRRVRTPWLVGLIVVGSVAAVAVPSILVLSGRGPPPFTPGPNTVVRLDPETGEVISGATVGTTPMSVAYGNARLWVANFDDRTIQPVDPETTEPGPAIGLTLQGHPDGIAVGGGFVWVASGISGVMFKVDPTTNAAVPIETGVGLSAVAFGEGAVWVTNGGTDEVLRIDPESGAIDRISLPEGSSPQGIAVGAGSVWVANSLKGNVARIDPETDQVVVAIPLLRGQPEQVAFGEGYAWVTNSSDDSVTRIDPRSNQGTIIDRVGNGPAGVAAGQGAVWVANSLDGTVARIDPDSARVIARIRLGEGLSPAGVAVTDDAVWVTIQAP